MHDHPQYHTYDSAGHDSDLPQGGLTSRSFLALLLTQFLTGVNDNMFRWLAVFIGKQKLGPDDTALVLSAGLGCFVLPYILLAAPAGYLNDRFSKRSVLVGCKVAEIAVMVLAVAAIWTGSVVALFAVVLLTGCQSAILHPAKAGCIPEILRMDKISTGNGLIGMTTVIAVVLGSVAGGYLFGATGGGERSGIWISALALIGVAMIGWWVSLFIEPLAAADPTRQAPRRYMQQALRDVRFLARDRALLRVAAGIAFFWSVASLAQMNVEVFGDIELNLQPKQIGPLLAVLAGGVGIGSLLAGIWSAGKVELGIVPLGAIGIAMSSMMLATVPTDPDLVMRSAIVWTDLWLFLLGISAGLFDVPLEAYMQHRSPIHDRGRILAAANFLTFSSMLVTGVIFYILHEGMGLDAKEIFLVTGVLTILVAWYAFVLLPQATIRFVVWLLTHTVYRVRVRGQENLPESGGALLVANHVSWLDGIFLLVASSRPIRLIAYAPYVQAWWSRWIARTMGVIPIGTGPRSIREALDEARRAVQNGELVCIFPEGSITRTGQLQAFKPGLLKIALATHAPIIPIYLDELWGSIFSNYSGRFFWKWPRHWPYPVTIQFGEPITPPFDLQRIRCAVQELGVTAVETRKTKRMTLPRAFLRNCRRNRFRPKMADSLTPGELSGHKVLLRTLILRRLLLREVLAPDEKYVGLLLPPSIGGALANAALPLAKRVAVNLNYTVSAETINSCIAQCGIRHVLTSRRMMERLKIEIDAELIYIEDFKSKVTVADKVAAAAAAYVVPITITERRFGLTEIESDDVLTVIFTSGSTGDPKGVMLSHHNVASNIEAINQVIQLRGDDVAIGVLPFFHSYGYTATLWTVLALKPKGVYHFNPLDAQQVGKLCREHRVTVFMATPTFLRTYLRRCEPEQLASLEVVFASAERLPRELSDAFEQKFGVRPSEAYGATELSPLVAVNIPQARAASSDQPASKDGTVGRPIPGVAAKIVHPETWEELGIDTPGMLLIKGPNVMKGYLHKPELTAEVIRDGWYVTGDIAMIDAEGFIHITGRESRFSKLAGEMVPHIKIEETLNQLLGADPDDLKAVVTAIPDARKGERIVVLHKPLDRPVEHVCRDLAKEGLPNLWIPSADSFCQIDEIPVLGTGKLDLKGMKQLALERFGTEKVI